MKRLKELVYQAWQWWRSVGIARRLGCRSSARLRGEVRVFYGHVTLPGRGQTAGGGLVKCQELQEEFPNTLEDATLLYLLSSGLPEFPERLVRAARRRGLGFVWNQNGVAYPAWHGAGWEQFNAPLARLLHAADHVFYQSEFCRMSADRFLGPRSGGAGILYNAVDTRVFVPARQIAPGLVIVTAGSHHAWYRVGTAIEAFRHIAGEVPDSRLIIAGRLAWRPTVEEARAELSEALNRLSLSSRVEVVGGYSQDEAVGLFQRAHLLLHAQYNDACPRMVLEAMACGVPIVYSASGGVPELVGPDAGIGIAAPQDWDHIHPPDPAQMAEAILRVAHDRARFSSAARTRAERFDVRAWRERHRDVFTRLVRSQP